MSKPTGVKLGVTSNGEFLLKVTSPEDGTTATSGLISVEQMMSLVEVIVSQAELIQSPKHTIN